MRPPRVFCYADANTLVPHCVAAAEMLRSELGAQIVMVIDRSVHVDKAFANYQLYEQQSLFAISKGFTPVQPVQTAYVAEPTEPAVAQLTPCADTKDANIPRDQGGNINQPGVAANPRGRIELFGLRKILARSETLRKIYSILRNPASVPDEARYWVRRIPGAAAIAELLWAWHKARRLRAFFREVRSDVIILAEDNVETLSTAIVNEGRRQGIASIVIPFTIPNPLEPAKSYRHRQQNQVRGPMARLVTHLFPKWCYRLGDQNLLRVPAFTALAMEALGHSSPAPWILNRGQATRVALDSEALRDRYLRLGFPASQLSIVGDINGAILHRGVLNKSTLRLELLARHGLDPARPLILCGFPPSQFGGEDNDFEFRNYDALMDAWMESFKALSGRANILIRPHPRVSIDRFQRFDVPNVRYSLEPTAELIPLCDLYVASISATIRWAIACGIPVINYDTYRYRYDDYEGAGGVIHVESLADFRTQLARFVDDPSFAACATRQQQSVKHLWGIIDDELPHRFAALVTEVANLAGRASD
jgi:hypothetical protein